MRALTPSEVYERVAGRKRKCAPKRAPDGSRLAAERHARRRLDSYAARIIADVDFFERLDEGDDLVGVTSLFH